MTSRPVNFRTLDLNLLKVFDVVMVERNVTRAATRLAMTQPAVSNALRRLREATHEDLFIPSSSGMAPTAQAEALWPIVRRALDGLRDAFEPQGFDARTDSRSFTLATTDVAVAMFAPALAQALQREPSQVDLHFLPLTTRDPRSLLELGQADVALGFFPDVVNQLIAEGPDGVIRRQPLYACRYVCVMRAGHRLSLPGALTLDSYCAAEHLRVSVAGRPRGFVGDALERLGRSRRVLITVNSFFAAGAVVHRTELLTVLPQSAVPAAGFAQALQVRELPFELPTIDVSLVWHRRHERDTAQRWLRDTVARAANDIAANM